MSAGWGDWPGWAARLAGLPHWAREPDSLNGKGEDLSWYDDDLAW